MYILYYIRCANLLTHTCTADSKPPGRLDCIVSYEGASRSQNDEHQQEKVVDSRGAMGHFAAMSLYVLPEQMVLVVIRTSPHASPENNQQTAIIILPSTQRLGYHLQLKRLHMYDVLQGFQRGVGHKRAFRLGVYPLAQTCSMPSLAFCDSA
jgi:hypothetical protein